MSKTKNQLPQHRHIWSAIFELAQRDRNTVWRRVTKTVVTSDSAGGLCDHPTQPGLEDCGWGVRLETLVVRQNNDGESGWEVVENYLEADEKVLAVLREWSDLESLSGDLDCRLADEIKAKEDARTQRIYEALRSLASMGYDDEDDEDDEDDDDSFWG